MFELFFKIQCQLHHTRVTHVITWNHQTNLKMTYHGVCNYTLITCYNSKGHLNLSSFVGLDVQISILYIVSYLRHVIKILEIIIIMLGSCLCMLHHFLLMMNVYMCSLRLQFVIKGKTMVSQPNLQLIFLILLENYRSPYFSMENATNKLHHSQQK